MTREEYERATELNEEIEKYNKTIISIKSGLSMKKREDENARNRIKNYKTISNHREEWTISKFFGIFFHDRKIRLLPHYEFAHGIDIDAEPELIDLILDYLQKKKDALEKEFEQIGGGIECCEPEEKKMTNADRIRNMTDEKLAEFLAEKANEVVSCSDCEESKREYGKCIGDCKKPYLKWLQAEVEEGA